MEVMELDTMGEPRNGPVQQALEAISGTLSVPQVFVNGEFMGDNSAIQAMGGDLKANLVEAGVKW